MHDKVDAKLQRNNYSATIEWAIGKSIKLIPSYNFEGKLLEEFCKTIYIVYPCQWLTRWINHTI